MRKAMTILTVTALGLAGTAWAGEKKDAREARVARAMAVAQIDFELYRAQLGLSGSSLLSERKADVETGRAQSVVDRAMAVAEIDFDLHRAHLGLAGSSLLSERYARRERALPPKVATLVAEGSAAPLEAPSWDALSEPR
ncbi:MAG TPA: hypothetical protein VIC87_14435 [Vicinamibacteria bacterium]